MDVDYFLDGLIGGDLYGWAVDHARPERHIEVRAYIGERMIAEATANRHRQDLADTFQTSGHHGFVIKLDGDYLEYHNFDVSFDGAGHLCISVPHAQSTHVPNDGLVLSLPSEERLLAEGKIIELETKRYLGCGQLILYIDTTEQTTADFMNNAPLWKHSLYVGTYRKSFIFGFHHLHAILSKHGMFTCQEITRLKFRVDVHNQFFGHLETSAPKLKIHDNESLYADFTFMKSPVIDLGGPVYFGSPIEPGNWGMWLLNGIHSASNYVAAGQPGKYLCYAATQWQRDLLRYVGVKEDKIIHQEPLVTYYSDEVSLLQYSLVDLVVDRGALAALHAIRDRCISGGQKSYPEKIFISRQSITEKLNGQRRLENENLLLQIAEQNGFSIVQPELLPFEEQVRVFANARMIVGIGGAAMFNTVFSRPNTKVISIEGTHTFIINHARMFASLDLEYGFIIGKENSAYDKFPHNPWSVDVSLVFHHLKRLGL